MNRLTVYTNYLTDSAKAIIVYTATLQKNSLVSQDFFKAIPGYSAMMPQLSVRGATL